MKRGEVDITISKIIFMKIIKAYKLTFFFSIFILLCFAGCGGGGGSSSGNGGGGSGSGEVPNPLPSDTNSPTIPSGLNLKVFSKNQINFSWNASSDNTGVSGYKIFRNAIYLLSTGNTSYSNTNLTPNTQYCYSTSAFDAYGNESDQSSMICVKTFAINLSDTGQTTSYTNTYGEDSDYIKNPPSFIDNGDGTVTDNNTDLLWQKTDDGTERLWDAAATYCNNLILGNFTDWRLPTNKELLGIVNYGSYPTYFSVFSVPKESSQVSGYSFYWSLTEGTFYVSTKWAIDFFKGSSGTARTGFQPFSLYTRCVRGNPYSLQDFIDNNDGTITDISLGLMWQKSDDNVQRTWEEAIQYCEDLNIVNYNDWRLPNIRELASITDETKGTPVNSNNPHPAIDTTFFQNTKIASYWTSTTYTFDAAFAYEIQYTEGIFGGYGKTSNNPYTRCLRDNK